MHLSSAVVGSVVLTLALGVFGCSDAPAPTDPQRRIAADTSSFLVTLVVRSADSSHWLRSGDSVSVRVTLAPDDSAARAGGPEGTITYVGVPLWGSASALSGSFETDYFTHPELGDRMIGLFFGANVAAARLILFVNPDPLAVTWTVTASGAGGESVTLARGDGVIGP
jgi:hypothetical protein